MAEGVENASILTQLGGLHCDEAQGCHLARPLDPEAFAAWVSQRALQPA